MTDPNQILDAYLDGQLTPEQFAELEAALCRNPAFADDFASAMLIDSCLSEKYQWQELMTALHLDDASAAADDVASRSANNLAAVGGYALKLALTSKPAKRVYACVGVAAALLLALVLLSPWSDNEPSTDAPLASDRPNTLNKPAESAQPILRDQIVATLTATHNAQWDSQPAEDLRRGSKLHPNQRLTLTAGFAEITTTSGAIAILEAPATIQLINDNALRLHAGKLVGLCHTDSSKGFVVRTKHADITDLGTEFAVQARTDGVDTTVFVGDVTLTTPGGATQPITTNQTARLSIQDGQRMIALEDKPAEGFARRLPRPALITDASINLD